MAVDITNVIIYKRLVTAGNSKIFFEDIGVTAGSLIELVPASADVDTTDQLTMTSAFQKVFVANGSNLKVADFINTKLTLGVFTTAPTRGSTIVQAGSEAEMVVDFVNGGLTEIYGYVTKGTFTTTAGHTISGGGLVSAGSYVPTGIAGMLTWPAALTTTHIAGDVLTQEDTDVAWADATDYVVGDVRLYGGTEYICIVAHTSDATGPPFEEPDTNVTDWEATVAAAMTVEGTDADKLHTWGRVTAGIFDTVNDVNSDGTGDDGVVPDAVNNKPPVWYDWTQYATTKALSTDIPAKAYLITTYRGRLVLSGNPIYPNQWYMSYVANPFNYTYGEDTPMSAVAGNNADAGQCPGIPRALISFHDDYLIFGCASTVWVLRGDPVAGGSLDNLSDDTGIFGANSYCFDENRNLYFWGTGGIYKLAQDFSNLDCISKVALPDLINDEAADPSTHTITMCYDRKRYGVVITVTKITDGTNSNYFYSLKTGGFYPESCPEQCGVYSMIYYAANSTALAELLLGSMDGYIRVFKESAKDDDIGLTNEAIVSYMTYPITPLSEIDTEGKLTELVLDLSGGGAGGDFSDTDGLTYSLYTGDDAETVLEKMKATTAWTDATNYVIGNLVTYGGLEYICIVAHLSATGAATHEEPNTNTTDWSLAAFTIGSITGSGRKNKLRPRMRGAFMGLKLSNSADTQTWAVNRVLYDTKPAGKV